MPRYIPTYYNHIAYYLRTTHKICFIMLYSSIYGQFKWLNNEQSPGNNFIIYLEGYNHSSKFSLKRAKRLFYFGLPLTRSYLSFLLT